MSNLHATNGQLQVIQALEEKLSNVEFQIRNYKKVIAFSKDHGDFYLDMQRKIISDESTMKAWKTFLTMVRLTIDGQEGITTK